MSYGSESLIILVRKFHPIYISFDGPHSIKFPAGEMAGWGRELV